MDRCSSNDSGLGTSSSLSPPQKKSSNQIEGFQVQELNEDFSEESEGQENIPRRKFPKLGISSLGVAFNFDSSSNSASTSDSEEQEAEDEDRPKTSTPQQSPSKIEGPEEASELSNQVWAELELTNQKHPLPSVEDLLYPGIKNRSSPSKFTKSSRRLLSGFKNRTSTGLLKLKSTVSDMMKSEREDLLLQQQVFDKITKTARDEDDFSIHMIEEVSIQRLKASVQSNSTSSSSHQVAFPPSGMTSCLQVKSTSGRQEGLQDEPTNRRSSPRSSGSSKPASGSSRRHQSRNRTKVSKSSEEQRRHRRNKRVISEVRKRVQEAHLKSGQSASGLVQTTTNQNIVPQAYRGRKLVYTRGGQVPQYRNGELDWNYLWFFSDSSSSATTSNSSANSTTLQQQILFDQSATSNSTDQSGESASSSGDSLNRNQLPLAPPPTIVNSQSKGRPHGGVMRQATKKRIRRLAANPPADDNIKLLGMV